MQEIFKKIITLLITVAAKILVFRHKPEIIAVTGSGGKTTTKEFLRELLEIDFEVMAPAEGYNTEIGAPLAFFDEKVPVDVTSAKEWLKILYRIYKTAIFSKHYADVLIVEMGADKPGDIKYLAGVFKPDRGIVTAVLNTHLQEFKTIEGVAREKSELVRAVKPEGRVYLNADDERVLEMEKVARGKVVLYGTQDPRGYVADALKSDISGLRFNLKIGDKKIAMAAPIYGKHMIYPLLAAIAVARSKHISMDKIKEKVKKLKPFRGRMNLLEGINESIIIDDSYNANPDSMLKALEFLADNPGRKLAILGTMNELGDSEEEAHRMVGEKAAGICDILVTVGKPAQEYLVSSAKKAGLKNVHSFITAKEAGEYLKNQIKKDDVILVKGSQNKVRTEQAIELIMAHPEQKDRLLVRQSDFWKEQE